MIFPVLSSRWYDPHSDQQHKENDEELLQAALRHFEAPGSLHPPASRVDPRVPQREPGSLISVRSLFKFGWFVAVKTREVVQDVLSHQIYGPKRPTWGIEMTIISSFMRNLAQHSELTNIAALRAVMAISGLVPAPSSAIITSVSFPVLRRKLPGILRDLDSQENGQRELHGEWVVGRQLWFKMQHEWKEGGKRSHGTGERVILYLHGGAYYVFSAATHRLITIRLSRMCGVRVFAINYRLAPETRFPGALHDAVAAYFRLTHDLKIPAHNIIVAGDSAGGGLAVALLMYLRDHKLPLPCGTILMSPWVDLTMSCASWETNAEYDVCPMPSPGDHLNPVYCYLGPEGLKKGWATNEYVSPLFGSFEGLPPMLVQCGEAEVLRDEGTLMAHKATRSGVEVVHEVYQDAVHVFQTFPFLPVAQKAFESCANFVNHSLPKYWESQRRQQQEQDDEQSMVDVDEEIEGGEMMVVDSTGEGDVERGRIRGSGGSSYVSAFLASITSTLRLDDDEEVRRREAIRRRMAQRDGTSVDSETTQESSTSPPTSREPSPASLSFIRSKSATDVTAPALSLPSSPLHRHHRRTGTFGGSAGMYGSAFSITPIDPTVSSTMADSENDVGETWAFSVTRPSSPVLSIHAGEGSYFSSFAAGGNGNGSASASGASTPAPALRKARSRSATVSGPVMELERMCREWERDGPANVSVLCRRV